MAIETTHSKNEQRRASFGWWAVILIAIWIYASESYEYFWNRSRYSAYANRAVEAGMALVIARAVFAIWFRNRSRWWIGYVFLLLSLGLLSEIVLHLAGARPDLD